MQVAEDSNSNLLHLIDEVDNGKPSNNTTALVQTGNGCQTLASGNKHLQGNVVHKYSGSFPGTKEDYIRAVHEKSRSGLSNKKILKSCGVKNLRKGTGAVFTAASIAAFAYSAAQVGYLWETFSADGIVTAAEWTRIGLEASECFNPIGSTISELGRSAFDPDLDPMSVAAESGIKDSAVEAIGNIFSFFLS